MNHVTVGVYKNGDYVVNVVRDSDIASHIEYNKIFRFGRALFVDGKCENRGYLTEEEVEAWEEKIKTFNVNKHSDTRPYIWKWKRMFDKIKHSFLFLKIILLVSS